MMPNFSYNDATINAYNKQFKEYIHNTPSDYNERHAFFLYWINLSLELITPNGKIFEIGSGHGRDAQYIESRGYNIFRSDAAQSFVDYLNSKDKKARLFNVLKDDFDTQYDMIYADGVMPHFKPDDLQYVLKKVYHSLLPSGIFTFDVKQGKGEEWINEKGITRRYTYYWEPKTLELLLLNAGYRLELFKQDVQGGDMPDRIWIHVIARKGD